MIPMEMLAFIIAAALAAALMTTLESNHKTRRRLRGQYATPIKSAGLAPLLKTVALTHPFLLWVQDATLARDEKEREKITTSLRLAGFDQAVAPVVFVVFRFSLAVGLPTIFVLSQHLVNTPMSGLAPLVMVLVLSALGLVAPGVWVNGRAAARRELAGQQFPDALDLLVVCIDAGLGIDAAFSRVGRELEQSHSLISQLFSGVSVQLSAGRSRADALLGLAQAADLESIRSFVNLLIRADSLGVSIAKTLQSYAAEMRAYRFHVAETKAMRVPLLITIPLITCLLPVIVGAMLLPPLIDLIRRFSHL